jgi:peptide/nickel transport system substrate-binding protein
MSRPVAARIAAIAHELPAMNLWYRDTIVVHNRRLEDVHPTPSGSFDFPETARLVP